MADAFAAAAACSDGSIAAGIGAPPPVSFVADVPLTDAQAAALAALRERSAAARARVHADDAYWRGDHALTRALGARRFDVDKALAMYEGIVRWRNEVQAWRFLDPAFYREPEALRRFFPWAFAGVDREGFQVLVERIGVADLLGMHDAVGADEFLRWVIFYHENQEKMMREASAALGKDRHKMTVLVDLKGYNMRLASSSTLAVLHKRTRLEEDNYPEVVKRLFLINTPSLFASAWGIVAFFMDEGTRNKVQLVGADYLGTVLKYVESGNVPSFLGGSLADCRGDAECRSIVAPGGLVPLAFLCGVASDGLGAGEEEAVAAGRASELTLRVPAGSTLAWKWGTAEKDLSFSVTAMRSARGAAVPAGVLDVGFATASVYGAHRCAASVSGAPLAAWPAAAVAASAAGAAAALAAGEPVAVVAPNKCERLAGSWQVPAASPTPTGAAAADDEAAECYLVRLRWDNSFSWMTSKRLARRVDVLVGARGRGEPGVSVAEDLDHVLACEREEHRRRICTGVA